MEHWYSAYMAAPSPGTTLAEKYRNDSIHPGMDDFVRSELARLKASASPEEQQAVGNATVAIDRCSESPILLVGVSTESNMVPRICISPLLLASVFLQSAGTDLLSYHDWLVSLGIDPGSFDGSYDSRLASSHCTKADWDAVTSSRPKVPLSHFRGSVDFILARALEEIANPNPPADKSWNSMAKELVSKSNGEFDVTALSATMDKAVDHYPDAAWGYETSGDTGAFAQSIRDIP